MEKLYTVEEVAKQLSVTGRTIRNYLKSGRLVGRKIGGQWRFPESEVQRLLNGTEPEAPAEQFQQPAPSPGIVEPSSAETFSLYRENEQDYADSTEDSASAVSMSDYEGPDYQDYPAPAPLPSAAPPASIADNANFTAVQESSASFNPFSAQPKAEASTPPLTENKPGYVQPVIPPVQKPNIQPVPRATPEEPIPAAEVVKPPATPSYGSVIAPPAQNSSPYSGDETPRYPQPNSIESTPTRTPAQHPTEPSAPLVQPSMAPVSQPRHYADSSISSPDTVRDYVMTAPIQPQVPQDSGEQVISSPPPQTIQPRTAEQGQSPAMQPPANPNPAPEQTQLPDPPAQNIVPPAESYSVPSPANFVQNPTVPTPATQEPAQQSAPPPAPANYQSAAYPYQPIPGYYYPYAPPAQNGYPIQAPWYPGVAPAVFAAPGVSADAVTSASDSKAPISGQAKDLPEHDTDDSVDNSPDLSDVGKQVLKFVSEVHDCTQGPCTCSVFDLYQSLNVAKSTSERLAAIAEQESLNGVSCQAYVEFDERYLLARYTLLGTFSFLSRCMQILG